MRISLKYLIALLLLLSGCASIPPSGPVYTEHSQQPDPNRALIYIYRPSTFIMSVITTNLFVNDEVRSVLSNGTFDALILDSGSYVFRAKQQPTRSGGYSAMLGKSEWEVKYQLEAGQTYYLVWAPSSIFSKKYEPHMQVSETVSSNNIAFGSLVQGKAVFGFVNPDFAKEKISTTKKTNIVPDSSRI